MTQHTHEYEMVIGIEVHCQLNTRSKLFCPSAIAFGDTPNTHVSPVNMALPGALPVLNKEAVTKAVIAGFALQCRVNKRSVFSRKNYFYPDLPKGYQISQFDEPLCEQGYIDIDAAGQTKRIGITRIHLEEDAGKLVHQGADSIEGATHSLVDLNRAGTPLIEIVSEPDIRTKEEARAYVLALKRVVQHAGICDGNLEEGSLRADINISLRKPGAAQFGTRAEIKNVNSYRSIMTAIEVEYQRQRALLMAGKQVIQETRNFDEASQTTTSLRGKEDAHDYRYFPEPDLPPLLLTDAQLKDIRNAMPMLPDQKWQQYTHDFNFTPHECQVLLDDVTMDAFFREVHARVQVASPKRVALWITGELNAMVKEHKQHFAALTVTAQQVADCCDAIADGTVSGSMAKEIQRACFESTAPVRTLIQERGAAQVSRCDVLQPAVDAVIAANPDVVAKIKAGKTGSINFLMGCVMKETRGAAKPDTVKALLQTSLGIGA